MTKPCFVVTLRLLITYFQQSYLFHLSCDPLLHMIGVELCKSGHDWCVELCKSGHDWFAG